MSAVIPLDWYELLKFVATMALHQATDPPEEYQGTQHTAKGNAFTIYQIPELFDHLPWQFNFTFDVPGYPGVGMAIREHFFEAGNEASLERLLDHEETHVDQWTELGVGGFCRKWVTNEGRMALECDAHSKDVIWRMDHDVTPVPHEGMDRLTFWMLTAAADVDQTYHIRGNGIRDTYPLIAQWVRSRSDYDPAPWDAVKHSKNLFRPDAQQD